MRAGTIRGRGVDTNGTPLADYSVIAKDVAQMENRFYSLLEVTTNAEGRFELRFLRVGG